MAITKYKRRIHWITFFIICLGSMSAQESQPSIDNFANNYQQKTGIYSALYYGLEYEGYASAKSHPFFEDKQYVKARLLYQQTIYPEVNLRYDMHRDELIVQSHDLRNIVLFPQKVEYAELHGKHIIYFQADTLPGCPASGYYILLHANNCKVMEKRIALLKEQLSQREIIRRFDLKTNFYLLIDGRYLLIKNQKGLLNALQPFDKELKRFISANHLKFRKDTESFLVRVVGEYETKKGSL